MLTDAEIAKLCRKAWSDDADTRHTLAPTDPVTRREIVAYRAAYAAGQAAASVPRGEPVAWYTPLIGNYAHVVWGKRPDTPMEWAPLYAAPEVAQEAAQDQSETECRNNPNTPLHDWKTREATRGGIYEQCAWCHNTRTPLPKDQSGEVASATREDADPVAARMPDSIAPTSPDPDDDPVYVMSFCDRLYNRVGGSGFSVIRKDIAAIGAEADARIRALREENNRIKQVDFPRKIHTVTKTFRDRAERAEAEVARLTQERSARNAIDPVTRLHNLCDHLAEHRAESPYNAEALELADADVRRYQAENAKLREANTYRAKWHAARRHLRAANKGAELLSKVCRLQIAEIILLRAQRDAAQGEPVAWQLLTIGGQPNNWIRFTPPDDDRDSWRPLYAAPAVAQDKEKP